MNVPQCRCRQCAESFEITQEDLDFLTRISPKIDQTIFHISPPTLCPRCRLQRRLGYRNQIHLFNRTCSASGSPIVSMWSEDAPFPVYKNALWWGDGWDPMSYGRPYSFTTPFFEQYFQLRNQVPHFALSAINTENSDYCNNVGGSREGVKNCYLIFNTLGNEDCMYGEGISFSKDCIDCTFSRHSELCYDCVWCHHCYQVQSSECCEQCRESFFLRNCVACTHCIACANLRHAQYCIFNQQYTKDEYERILRELRLSAYSSRVAFAEKAHSFLYSQPRPHQWMRHTEEVDGNFVSHSKNVADSFFCEHGEKLRYCLNVVERAYECRDYTAFGYDAEFLYECASSGLRAKNCQFCVDCWEGVSDLLYCSMCAGSSHCFGCVGLRKAEYCILNVQYSRQEYFALLSKIIAHMRETREWGEFFPLALSCIPYNRSYAQRYFPLQEEEARARGLMWYSKNALNPRDATPAQLLPDEVPNEDHPITTLSALSGRPFRITAEEIKKYRALAVPLPRTTYDERMDARAQQLGDIALTSRTCAKSGESLLSAYSSEYPYTIWERSLYAKEFGE